LSDFLQEMIKSHTEVGPGKPLSYLPINTIVNVLGMTVEEYQRLVSTAGNDSILLDENRCCIRSGAVYAFSEKSLDGLLKSNFDLLVMFGWPSRSRDFVEKIAVEWVDENHPIFPIVQQAFGDA
jgi:hypothetical protein